MARRTSGIQKQTNYGTVIKSKIYSVWSISPLKSSSSELASSMSTSRSSFVQFLKSRCKQDVQWQKYLLQKYFSFVLKMMKCCFIHPCISIGLPSLWRPSTTLSTRMVLRGFFEVRYSAMLQKLHQKYIICNNDLPQYILYIEIRHRINCYLPTAAAL